MPYLGRSKAASAFLNNKIDVGFYVVHGEGVPGVLCALLAIAPSF